MSFDTDSDDFLPDPTPATNDTATRERVDDTTADGDAPIERTVLGDVAPLSDDPGARTLFDNEINGGNDTITRSRSGTATSGDNDRS